MMNRLLATLVLLAVCIAAPAAAQVDLRFSPPDTVIQAGDTCRVSIMLDQVIPVRTIDVHVEYEKASS